MSHSYRLKISRPSLKLKVATRIPAQLIGGTGVTITKEGGVYTFDVDEAEIQDVAETAAIAAANTVISGATGITIQAYDADLEALADNSSDGLWTHTGAGTGAARTIAASTGLAVTNGNGVSGNPTIALDLNALTADASPVGTTDYVATYDASASGHKKVLLDNLPNNYTQSETSAVPRTMIQRFSNTLFASEFGAVGDDSTNDRVALQAWLDAVASSHKEGRLDPGKKYFVSGGDLSFTSLVGGGNYGLYGYGSMLRTDPSAARTALLVDWDYTGATRVDEGNILLIEGWTFNQYDDANAIWGIQATGLGGNIVIRNNHFASGSDDATVPSVNYGAIRMKQGDNTNPDTGIFWVEIEGNRFKGGATGMPNALWLEGAVNAVSITKNNFANVDTPVRLLAADRTGTDTANAAVIPNGVKILDNSFEGIIEGIKFNGNTTTTNKSRSVGLEIQNNRIESINVSGAFFQYSGINLESEAPPILGPNYLSSGDTARYVLNTNNLVIEKRDGSWMTKTPTVTSTSGSFTSVACTLAYRLEGTKVDVIGTITITTNGTAAGFITVPLPVGTLARNSTGFANESVAVGSYGDVRLVSGGTTAALIVRGGSWFVNNAVINFSFTYEKVAT